MYILGDELRKFTGLKTLEITTSKNSDKIHQSLFDEACWACRYIETLEKLVIVSGNYLPLGVQGIYYANLKQLDLRECSLTNEQISEFYQFSKKENCEVLFSESDDRIKKNEVRIDESRSLDKWIEHKLWRNRIKHEEEEQEKRRRESRQV